jgi:hypothetical protein
VAPNPEAIAWYVERSEALLGDLRELLQSLRVRGGQLAGFSGAVLAVAGANAEAILDALHGAARHCAGVSLLVGVLLLAGSLVTALRGILLPQLTFRGAAQEVANFTSRRFTDEPDLWRVHLRTIRGLLALIESTSQQADRAAVALRMAGRLFLVGLFAVGNALGILVLVVTF